MSEFILAWVLVTSYHGLQYSPPVKTVEDCKRLQEFASKYSTAGAQCIQVNILRKAEK